MTNDIRWGLDKPHPFSQMKTELIWEGKYDEYRNRRTVDIAACAVPLQKIETIDEPAHRAMWIKTHNHFMRLARAVKATNAMVRRIPWKQQ
jgi:hypothetical protein